MKIDTEHAVDPLLPVVFVEKKHLRASGSHTSLQSQRKPIRYVHPLTGAHPTVSPNHLVLLPVVNKWSGVVCGAQVGHTGVAEVCHKCDSHEIHFKLTTTKPFRENYLVLRFYVRAFMSSVSAFESTAPVVLSNCRRYLSIS